VHVSEFDYHLPKELIAQEPLEDRAASRMLRLSAKSGRFEDGYFRQFPELLQADDLVVFNNTKVFPARLYGRRGGLHAQAVGPRNPAARNFLAGQIEVLLTRQVHPELNEWECLARPGRKIALGERLFFGENDELQAEVIARNQFGERRIRFAPTNDFFALIEKIGHVPLPPYIAREDSSRDKQRYQTVYARERGSVAAPTAGLHFTPEILAGIRDRRIDIAELTLHIGLGTFQPVRVEQVEQHPMHPEAFAITLETAEKINRAVEEHRRIVAVGTTTVRALEFAAQAGAGKVLPGSGEANLFIYPGHRFRIVEALLTNLHLPQSTLLMLVCGLGGKQNVMRAYAHAVNERYRFYSYGDCMFVE
jgi:S-adenosylmethionine:tRNA ribosyltransferase-isomerase